MRRTLVLAPLVLVLAACGPASSTPSPPPEPVAVASPAASGPAMLPILASSELATGPNRFLFSLTDRREHAPGGTRRDGPPPLLRR